MIQFSSWGERERTENFTRYSQKKPKNLIGENRNFLVTG
jgi:hypothetical protein